MFNKLKAFGIDISDFSLKIIDLEEGKDGLNLKAFGSAEIPSGIIEEGEIKNEKELAEIIKRTLKEVKGKKIKTRYVIVSLPEERAFLDVIRIPLMKEKELETAIKFEIENYIPLSLNEVYFDFEKIKSVLFPDKYQEILITALPRNIVDGYLRTLKLAGLQPLALELECASISRSLIKKDKVSELILIIDFGKTRVTFVFFSGKDIRFTSTISFSSQQLTKVLSEKLGVSLEEAEKMKIEQGLIGEKQVSDLLIPLMADFTKEIKKLLEYYYTHKSKQLKQDNAEVQKILLCGGAANLKGLTEFLNSELKIEVEIGNPWINILKDPLKQVPELSFDKSLSYATALGLALRNIYDD